MQEVLQELAVLLVVLCAGMLFGKKGLLNEDCVSQLNKAIVNISFPALIIASMDKDFTPELLRNSIGLAVISWLCFSAVIVFLEIWKHFSKRPPKELGLLQFLIRG